ncbi:MAG: hypothetical protein P8J87_18135 [Verrucomicrobiales bacterium]|nr:hypothetical protein [Verrucomicrobiales bacterium]
MRPPLRKIILLALLVTILAAVSLAIIRYNRTDAFVYVCGLWGIACLVAMRWLDGVLKIAAWNIAIVAIIIGVVEAWLAGWISKGDPNLVNFSLEPHFIVADPILGYRPSKNGEAIAKKVYGDETLYEVRYTINAWGQRAGPESSATASNSALLFGGSFTFGEGVHDHETLPWRFDERTGENTRAINLGLFGYGPHQMLAMLENQLEAEAVEGTQPVAAIYHCIPNHVARSAGAVFWDTSGPHYVLDFDGSLKHDGPFRGFVAGNMLRILSRSQIAKKILRPSNSAFSEENVKRLAAIVESSQNILRERYGIDLLVLLWYNEPENLSRQIVEHLGARDVEVLRVDAIIPDINGNDEKYLIAPPIEGHPNGVTNDLLAAGLVEHLGLAPADSEGAGEKPK